MEGGQETDGLKPGDPGFDPEGMMPFGPKPVPEHRWFESKSLLARLFIMIAGVTMNIVLAFAVYAGLFMTSGVPVIATRVVGAVRPLANAPTLAGLQAGDTIVAVNGEPVRNWEDVMRGVLTAPAGPVTIRTHRGAVTLPVGSAGAPTAIDVLRAIDYYSPPVIGQVLPGSPALRAGLQVGDSVVTIGHQPVTSWSGLVERVTPAAGTDLPFEVRRAGRLVSVTVRPQATPEVDPVTKVSRSVGRIGAARLDVSMRQTLGVAEGIRAGARQTWYGTTDVLGVLKKLFTRQNSVKELGGPIAIIRASVSAGQSGLAEIFMLIALISVNVAVLNLLPIPILDGGQILVNIAESVKGSALSARTREYILRVGLAAILLIFAMSTFNDLVRLVKDYGGRLFG
jgi:regulator of sigma E protease